MHGTTLDMTCKQVNLLFLRITHIFRPEVYIGLFFINKCKLISIRFQLRFMEQQIWQKYFAIYMIVIDKF